jgi:nucleolar protein 56
VKLIKNKGDLKDSSLGDLEAITSDPIKAKQILDASKSSMGTDLSIVDMINIERFADRVISLNNYRKSLYAYLVNKMHAVAPNVSALIGEIVGARLIAQAGSLTNLAKYPASTIQILGAEKALFRALKTKGNTPKYGLIYHSTFIGRASPKFKGRISRILANKLSIASRLDCFLETPTTKFGEILKTQIEERLEFYETGKVPRKNSDMMADLLSSLDSPSKKRPLEEEEEQEVKEEEVKEEEVKEESPKKKKKKSKTSSEDSSKKSKKDKKKKKKE